MSEKAKYWTFVFYPENMRDDWQNVYEDLIGVPSCYIIHDKDKLQAKSDIIEHDERKLHGHGIIAMSNTTTEKTVYNLVNQLSASGRTCCPKVFVVRNIRKMYDYLIHDTNNCHTQGKHLYLPEERIEVNNFDIGCYEQISLEEKNIIAGTLADIIVNENIRNFIVFYKIALERFDNEQVVKDIIKGHSGYFDRLIKGNFYLKLEQDERIAAESTNEAANRRRR